MSIAAIKWALWQSLRASEKIVLFVLGNHANDHNLCWPSHASLRKSTGLDRKTIIKALARLQKLGLISDTGRRKGSSGRVKVYYLHLDVNVSDKKGAILSPFTSSGSGTPQMPKTDFNNPHSSSEQSPKRDTEPSPNPHLILSEAKAESLRGNKSGLGADSIKYHLDDDDFERICQTAPGENHQSLFRRYDAWVADKDRPRNPKAAFFGWLQKFIRGKHASSYRLR